MTMVFGLGMTLCVCMHTRLENGILCNGQLSSSAVKSFIDGKFEANEDAEWL